MDLFIDRASCHRFGANPFRQLLSALAYTLIKGLRRLALGRTVLATAGPNRIRLTLLRTEAVVVRNTRRIWILLSSTCPHQEMFRTVAAPPGHLLTVAECYPGTLTNNGGKGEVCQSSAKTVPEPRIMGEIQTWEP